MRHRWRIGQAVENTDVLAILRRTAIFSLKAGSAMRMAEKPFWSTS
jgi:hypothetical protein